jgi:hypothetical protein
LFPPSFFFFFFFFAVHLFSLHVLSSEMGLPTLSYRGAEMALPLVPNILLLLSLPVPVSSLSSAHQMRPIPSAMCASTCQAAGAPPPLPRADNRHRIEYELFTQTHNTHYTHLQVRFVATHRTDNQHHKVFSHTQITRILMFVLCGFDR